MSLASRVGLSRCSRHIEPEAQSKGYFILPCFARRAQWAHDPEAMKFSSRISPRYQ